MLLLPPTPPTALNRCKTVRCHNLLGYMRISWCGPWSSPSSPSISYTWWTRLLTKRGVCASSPTHETRATHSRWRSWYSLMMLVALEGLMRLLRLTAGLMWIITIASIPTLRKILLLGYVRRLWIGLRCSIASNILRTLCSKPLLISWWSCRTWSQSWLTSLKRRMLIR